jgi:hypothetical protein
MGSTYIVGLGTVPPYTGEFPSPLHVMWYVPANLKEVFKLGYSASEIRGWVRQAADYHDVPLELAAAILQQENSPHASKVRQFLQFGERSVETFAAILDEVAFDLVPDKVAGGSSGIANMSRKTLRGGAEYVERVYQKPVMPDSVRYRILGWDQDTRIQGDDLRGDLYYMTAHLRQLIDRVTGTTKYQGQLTLGDVEKIAAAYNGSGPQAQKYGRDTITRLHKAVSGAEPLYFYE